MGILKDRYDELFGQTPDYDPIKLQERTEDRADAITAAAPSASPRMAIPPLGPPPKPRTESSGVVGNVARQVGAGALDVADMLTGAAGYAADFFVPEQIDDLVADTFYGARQGINTARESILSGIDDEAKRKAAAEFLTLDPNRTIWSGNPLDVAEAILYKTARALPATLATLAPAAVFAKAGASAKAIKYMGASEGTLSLGGIANGISDEIRAIPTEQLMQESPRFAQLLQENGGDADAARNDLIREAQGFAPIVGGAAVAAVSSVAGRYFVPIFEKPGQALGGRIAAGVAAEAPPESIQGGVEQLVQNYSAKIYDADRQLNEGLAEAMVQEGVIGGIMGGGAGVFGQGPERAAPPPPPRAAIDLDARPDLTVQPDLPGFEPGGEPPLPGAEGRTFTDIPETNEPSANDPNARIVQLIDNETGAIVREELAADQAAGEALGKEWQKDKKVRKATRLAIIPPYVRANQQQQSGEDVTFPIQEDLFDNRAARGTDFTLVPDEPYSGEPTQQDLPLTEGRTTDQFGRIAAARQKGVGRVPIGPGGERGPVPTEFQTRGGDTATADMFETNEPVAPERVRTPEDEDREVFQRGPDDEVNKLRRELGLDVQDADEVGRRQYSADFEDTGTETVTRRSRKTTKTGKFLVRLYDDKGNVIAEERRNSRLGAEVVADQWYEDFPDGNVQVVPETVTEADVKTRAEKRGPKLVEPEYEQPIDEEVQQELRAKLPFEERSGPIAEVKGARSYGQASDKLISRASSEFDQEEKARIGGFYNPDRLEFENAEYAAEYKAAWDELVSIRQDMIDKGGSSQKMKDRRSKLLQELAKLRTVGRPKVKKGTSELYVKAAKAINPAEVESMREERQGSKEDADIAEIRRAEELAERKRKYPEKKGDEKATWRSEANIRVGSFLSSPPQVGETGLDDFKPMTRKKIDNLPAYEVHHKTPKGEWSIETGFKTAEEATARRDELKKKYPLRTVKREMKSSRALDEEFEKAVIFREGRVEDTSDSAGEVLVEAAEEKTAKLTGEVGFEGDTPVTDEGEVADVIDDALPDLVEVEGTSRVNRAKYNTPGKKLKFIRRESEIKRRIDTGQKNVKAATVRAETIQEQNILILNPKGEVVQEVRAKNAATAAKKIPKLLAKYPTGHTARVEPVLSKVKRKQPHRIVVKNKAGKAVDEVTVPNKEAVPAAVRKLEAKYPGSTTSVEVLTSEDEGKFYKRVVKSEQGKKLDTTPLTVENIQLDEGVAAREKRVVEAKEALKKLGQAASAAGKYLTQLRKMRSKGTPDSIAVKYGDQVAKDFLYARNYLEQLIQFARSVQATKGASKATIKLAEGITEMLEALTPDLQVDVFATEWGALARANAFDDLAAMRYTSLAGMRDASKRAKDTKKQNAEVRSRTRMRQLNESLKNDTLYNNSIRGVLEKMSQYVYDAAAGLDVRPYIPNEAEMGELKFALNMNRNVRLYDAVREQMRYAGFQFDEHGYLRDFEAPGPYLDVATKAKRGKETPPPPTAAAIDAEMDRGPRREEQLAVQERREAAEAVSTYEAVNYLINRFKKAVASTKITRAGIIRQEQRFIRGLKELGVWRDTSPGLGSISIEGFSVRTYRLVGPRLGKTLLNASARETISKMRVFPIPRAVAKYANRVSKRDGAGPQISKVRRIERFMDEDLFLRAAQPVEYDAEYTSIADRLLARLMEGKLLRGTDVVNMVLELAPQNSFYRNLAVRLAGKDMSGVKVGFGDQSDFPRGQAGRFVRKSNTILLNPEVLNSDRLGGDTVYGGRVTHTVMHEAIHALTHINIDNNPTLRRYLEGLQARARRVWADRIGTPTPYGLKTLAKSENEVHEFVAEAFSNHEFQMFLRDTPNENGITALWRDFINGIRSIFGFEPKTSNAPSLFDSIMLTEDVLFDEAGIGSVAQGDLWMTGEGVIDNISSHVQDLANKAVPMMDKLRNAGRNLMTFEQLRDTYQKYFDKDGDNSFARYMDAWARRNATISKHMKPPEALSVEWTSLEASKPEDALAISRIGTTATIDKLTPSKALTAEERAELDPGRLKKYDELRAQYLAMSPEAQSLYQKLRDWYEAAHKDEAELLMYASLRGVLTKGRGAKLTQAEFEKKFSREVIAKMTDEASIAAALKDVLSEEDVEAGLPKQIKYMASLRTQGWGDYFPLMRYGDYVVFAETSHPKKFYADIKEARAARSELLKNDPTLDVDTYEDKEGRAVLQVHEREFWMFENKTQATAKRAELVGKYTTVSRVQARISTDTEEMAISSNAALQSILTSLSGNPAAMAAVKTHYLKSLADQSFRKHELRRKNRRGVDYDIQHRNLANYMKQSAYYRGQLEHGWRMAEALRDMAEFSKKRDDTPDMPTERLQQVVIQVQKRDQMSNSNEELNKMVRSGVNVTQFMMLTSPSYWMINATQPWLVTVPVMGGKYGFGEAAAAMKDAMNLVKMPLTKEALNTWFGAKALTNDRVAVEKAFNVVDQLIEHIKGSGDPRADELATMIDELRDINIIDINVLTELRQIAEGIENNLWTRTLDASRILAHLTEVSNRTMTAIAAYNLARSAGESVDAAKKYAADMVSQTQFNYSSQNKPPLFQTGGPLKWAAPLMFQFMQWPQHMYALLIRNTHAAFKGASKEERDAARRALIGLLGTHAAVGGAVGMTLQPIKWALGMALMAFGDDDEPYTFANAVNGRTFDNLVAEVMSDLFGEKAGRAAAFGLPTLLGTDMSARMSMGTLYFVDLRGDTAESMLGSLAASFGGATLNQVMNWGNALGKVADGEVYRGIEQASPKIFRDIFRANRYYREGLVNNAGDTVIPAKDLSFGEVFLQGIGFSPDEVSKFYQGQAAIKGAQGYARDRRETLVRKFVNDGMSDSIMREVLEFNRAYPSLVITRSTLIRGAQAQIERETKYGRYGANIDAEEAQDFADYGDPFQ